MMAFEYATLTVFPSKSVSLQLIALLMDALMPPDPLYVEPVVSIVTYGVGVSIIVGTELEAIDIRWVFGLGPGSLVSSTLYMCRCT